MCNVIFINPLHPNRHVSVSRLMSLFILVYVFFYIFMSWTFALLIFEFMSFSTLRPSVISVLALVFQTLYLYLFIFSSLQPSLLTIEFLSHFTLYPSVMSVWDYTCLECLLFWFILTIFARMQRAQQLSPNFRIRYPQYFTSFSLSVRKFVGFACLVYSD